MEKHRDTGYVVPHTHWDREWRYPVWESRMHLVAFMDELLALLDGDPAYKSFLLDGQSVIIQDYLEVRPERREDVVRHIRGGRIAIGPWYTLPDLYPVDGESLVRNLLKGARYAEGLGDCLKVGYNSFGWGQTAQFPQIYRGFGIDAIVTAKHVSKERAPESEFLWEAPDGTQALATRLGAYGRANFFMHAYIPIVHGVGYFSEDFRHVWGQDKTVHRASPEEACHEYLAGHGARPLHTEKVKSAVQAAWEAYSDTLLPEHRLLMDGSDFSTPQPELSEIIRLANAAFDDKTLVSASLEEYIAVLKEKLDKGRLRVIHGELRDGPPSDCSANALATRPRLKRLNRDVQAALLRLAEPLSVLARLLGMPYEKRFLDIAMEYMLKSHAHDTINGVTRDKTANDAEYRLCQALEIAQTVADKACRDVIGQIDTGAYAPDDVLLVLFNPLPHERSGVVTVAADLPRELNAWDFAVLDAEERTVETQIVSRQEVLVPVHKLNCRPLPYAADRYHFHMKADNIPALGYKVFRIEPQKRFNRAAVFWPPARTSNGQELARAANLLENAFLRACIEPDGTLTLTDKTTGRVHARLNYLEDTGDCGDYWVHYPPYQNRTFVGAGSPRIWLEENGPLSATIGVSFDFRVPAFAHRPEGGIRGESRRDGAEVSMPVALRYTLKKDARHLECELTVNNTAKDHRLRLLMDTGIKTEYADAAGHFTVDRRPAEPPRNADGDFYPEMRTLPMQQFVDVSNGGHGFAVLGGFTEYELLPGEAGTLALTVFRSMRNIICTEFRSASVFDDEDGGQSLGPHTVRFALYPHAGNWAEAGVYRQADEFFTALPMYQTSAGAGTLPAEGGMLTVEPPGLVVSAIKCAEDRESVIVRLFNPTGGALSGEIRCGRRLCGAWLVNLNEERQGALPIEEETRVKIDAEAEKILTIELICEGMVE